ncbi:hypothetical protein RI578_10425 [Streptomyces sp. BB1-1-1]|uniref:hypothetical protein n=1 Tax=Streptomyces sp. BB1-1-1 TaxID=3074430 RepID=UPI002877894A|nr:hypothetical protein [Streptomyces sp. BB1-1-1]WND34674.1 hypothetical protein RI578_10425 [Streptomyces sp. BB1-1-1]
MRLPGVPEQRTTPHAEGAAGLGDSGAGIEARPTTHSAGPGVPVRSLLRRRIAWCLVTTRK